MSFYVTLRAGSEGRNMMICKNIVFCQYLEGHLLVALGDHEMCHVGENNAISRSLEHEHEHNIISLWTECMYIYLCIIIYSYALCVEFVVL